MIQVHKHEGHVVGEKGTTVHSLLSETAEEVKQK